MMGDAAMPLNITIKQETGRIHEGPATIALSGSLDTATSPDLEKRLSALLSNAKLTELVFDLAELQFISSAGLRVFSAVRKTVRERNGQVLFINLRPQIQEVFEIVKSLPGFQVFASVQEFDDYLAKRQRIASGKEG